MLYVHQTLLTEPRSSLTYSNLIPGRNPGNTLPSFFGAAVLVRCWLHTELTWELADAHRAGSGLHLTK